MVLQFKGCHLKQKTGFVTWQECRHFCRGLRTRVKFKLNLPGIVTVDHGRKRAPIVNCRYELIQMGSQSDLSFVDTIVWSRWDLNLFSLVGVYLNLVIQRSLLIIFFLYLCLTDTVCQNLGLCLISLLRPAVAVVFKSPRYCVFWNLKSKNK